MMHLILELIGTGAAIAFGRVLYIGACLGDSVPLMILSWVIGLSGAGLAAWSLLTYFGVM